MNNESLLTQDYIALGNQVIDLLGLKVKRSNGRVDTTWGDKTPEGLGRTIHRLVIENVTCEVERLL